MPESTLTKMPACRNCREVYTGSATNGGSSRSRDFTYEDIDISATSNSRCRSIRKKVSSTGSRR